MKANQVNRTTLIAVLVLLLSACSSAESIVDPAPNALTPYDDPTSPEWSELDRSAKAQMAQALSAYPEVKVAYLLKRFDENGASHFALDIVFDGEANSEALNAADAAFAQVAPSDKKLEILLLTPAMQAAVVKQANATPFYLRK